MLLKQKVAPQFSNLIGSLANGTPPFCDFNQRTKEQGAGVVLSTFEEYSSFPYSVLGLMALTCIYLLYL